MPSPEPGSLSPEQRRGALLDMASTWAVKLNMEISRGHGLFTADQRSDELRKRFLGGLAVRF